MATRESPEQPKLAIVGRPNVGKSTLFNRLTGGRTALVSNLPGLTRDRRDGVMEIAGHSVTILDTAGLEEARSGSIAARMRAQTERAIHEADLSLFVIDARDGITPADETFARIVRQSGKPALLVANKCEGRAGEGGFYDAFSLGLGEPTPISAEHGEGLADLLIDIQSALYLASPSEADAGDAEADQFDRKRRGKGKAKKTAGATEAARTRERPLRVAIVGRPNVGKSTLINAFVGEDRMITGPEPGLTRDSIATDVTLAGRRFKLFDTAGLRRKARIEEKAEKLSASDSVRAIRFAEVVVLMIDAERPLEHQDLTIGDMVTREGRALVIALNKWDLVKDKQALLKRLHEALGERLSQVPGVRLIPVSALAEKNLDKLVAAIVQTYEVWNTRIPTGTLNRWLADALQRHQPPAVSGRRIKMRFITQPSARPPTFVAFCSKPDQLPKSYVRYLTSSLRDAFELPGVPIRFNLRKGDNPYEQKSPRG